MYNYFYIFSFLLFFAACNKQPAADKYNSQKSDTLITKIFKPVSSIKVNLDYLKIISPGQNGVPLPKVIKAGKPRIEPYRNAPVLPGMSYLNQSEENKSTDNLPDKSQFPITTVAVIPEVFTPGKGTVSLPKCYFIKQSSSFRNPEIKNLKSANRNAIVLSSDSLQVPEIIAAKQVKPVTALSPRFMDNATCNIQYLDVDQGMSSSYIMTMMEDSRGNLWFGTFGVGITRYDGLNFTHYNLKDGLRNNYIRSVIEDKSGNIWFSTDGGGVCKYDGQTFMHFTTKEGLINDIVWTVFEDKTGNLWFGTNGGVCKFDGLSFTNYSESEGLCNNKVKSICEDRYGNLWFGTSEGGISKFDGKSFNNFSKTEGLGNKDVLSIIEDRDGNLWFGTDGNGVFKYNGNITGLNKEKFQNNHIDSFIQYTEKSGLSNNHVKSILEDKSGNIWFGTYGGGVTKFDGKTFTYCTLKDGLSSNYVCTVLEDSGGNLWFGTDGGGVNKFNNNSFTHYTKNEGLGDNLVVSILEDHLGNLWFGTWTGGVSKYDGKVFTHYTEKEGLSNNYVWSVYEDKKGNLWFGTSGGGVNKFDGNTFTQFTEKEGLDNYVRAILEDSRGNLWFSILGKGVCKYNGNSFTYYTEKDGLCSNTVFTMYEDKEGYLWLGSDAGGVSKFDGNSFTNYSKKNGLNNNYVRSIHEDNDGNLWFGTLGGGVNKFHRGINGQPDSFSWITENDGLCNDLILSICDDNRNNIWLGTDKGLAYLLINEDKNKINGYKNIKSNTVYGIYTFGTSDGLKGLDFNTNSVCRDHSNRIWWGNGKALTMLDLNTFRLPGDKPRIQLNNIELMQNYLDYHALSDSVLKDSVIKANTEFNFDQMLVYDPLPYYNYPLHLELPYNLNHLTFNFSAVDWAAPHKIQYCYMLEGLDNDWSLLSKESSANYRNIPYGSFTFKVKAIGAAGKWSDTFEYSFVIRPPWWHTWWFRTIIVLCVLFMVYCFVKWRERKLKRDKIILQNKVDEQTSELSEKNEALIQQNEEITSQRDEIEAQRDRLGEQNLMLAGQKRKITDSINYAKRIQEAVLPTWEYINSVLGENFILYRPKDIVSGDFYWVTRSKDRIIVAVADCTGHGVPGAFMSMLGISFLSEIVRKEESIRASGILDNLRVLIIEALRQRGVPGEQKDGMDMALVTIDTTTLEMQFAGANNPLYIVRKSKAESEKSIEKNFSTLQTFNFELSDFRLYELKGDKMPVAIHEEMRNFTNNVKQLTKGDMIYLMSDGFEDQFGGPKNKKFMIKQLKELLLSISQKNISEQKQILENTLLGWIGDGEQIDDITLIGIKI